jgi:hypothetical protein
MTGQYRYVLDCVLDHVDLSSELQCISDHLLVMFRLSPPTEMVETRAMPAAPRISFQFPVRVLFRVDDISSAYFFAQLCTVHPLTVDRRPIGRSKVALKSLPVGSPKRFRFPVLSLVNNAIRVAEMTLTATLSVVLPYIWKSEPARFGQPPSPPPPPRYSSYQVS